VIWLHRIAIGLAALAAAALLLSGPGMRLGLWPYQAGLLLLLAAGIAGLSAAVLAFVGLCIPGIRKANFPWLLAALVLGAGSASVPLEFLRQARSVPPINDISTDLANPAFAEQQRKAYPDIQPLELAEDPATAYSRALAAAEAMGWEIVRKDPAAGRIEAVATSAWFGFKDDVVVRVAPAIRGSRVDVRSKSRVGRSDIGTNARRIRAYLQHLK
jgi:uncharacterized protein (DUF1499 family)